MAKEHLFSVERNWRTFGGVIVASGALALAGCGGGIKKRKQ
jgi:hypothetical protein